MHKGLIINNDPPLITIIKFTPTPPQMHAAPYHKVFLSFIMSMEKSEFSI